MKQIIYVLLLLVFFSCTTEEEVIVTEESKLTNESLTGRQQARFQDDDWGSVTAYDVKSRERVKLVLTYGQYSRIRTNGTRGMEFLKVRDRAIYVVDTGRINVGMPNVGNPLPFAGCEYFNSIENSSSTWAQDFMAGNISLTEYLSFETMSQQAEANSSGQPIFFLVCLNGAVVGSINVYPDSDGFVTNPGSGASASPGSWIPY